MKIFIAGLCFIWTLCCSALADTYRGTITQIIAPFTDTTGWYQQYQSGATYTGYYQYESESIDGTFYVSGPWGEYYSSLLGYPVNDSLNGSVFLPFPENAAYGSHGAWNDLTQTSHGGTLTVIGGVVSSFVWFYESGGLYADFSSTGFSAIVYNDLQYFFPDLPEEEWPTTLDFGGSMTMSAPSRVSEGGYTMFLLSLPILLLGSLRQATSMARPHCTGRRIMCCRRTVARPQM